MNTIFAQCSARGKAGVAVFRISGPNALKALELLMNKSLTSLMPRTLYLRKIYRPKNAAIIDESMVVFFQGNESFTGEDSVEIYTHGSLAVIQLLSEALSLLPDLRIAEPGEFARRSFLNGKMDLTAAEGLADLIDAETELQHKQAIIQLSGGLQNIYDNWRTQLISIIGLIEAYIDFPDEDIPEETLDEIQKSTKRLIEEIKNHLNDNNRGERLRNGIKLAIIGQPNVGKSSLLNHLMQREMSIVSNIAGTTRDVIEGHLDIGGYPIILQDTAGINEHTLDVIEQEGVNKAWHTAKDSDIKIIMYDSTETNPDLHRFSDLADNNTIAVFNKADLALQNIPKKVHNIPTISTSIKTSHGITALIGAIISSASNLASPTESPQLTRARHRSQLERAVEYLSHFMIQNDLVLAAEDLRMTVRSISNITGKITVDEVLGEIFSNFCIGK